MAFAAWTCAGALACGSSARQRPPPPLDVAALAAPSSSPHSARAQRDHDLAPLMALVARRRGLEFLEPPELEALERGELVRRALRWIETQTSPALQDAQTELLMRLELVPRGFSRTAALARLLERRLHAFYDPASRRILIDRALSLGVRRRVLAHELVHALVDQRHALGARLSGPGSADRKAALLTLAEGDADALVAELWEAQGAPELGDAALSDDEPPLPDVLVRALSAPYADGQTVVRRLLDTGGFASVDALYRDPPDGTHQLLDPEFPARLAASPPELPAPTPPGPGWTLAFSDVLGEQTWRTVLEQWLPPERAAALAGGWHGDRLASFERGTQRVLVWEVRSDAERATPVVQVVSHGLSLSPPARDGHTPRASALSCRPHRDAGVMGLWMRGRSLFLTSLVDAAQTAQCEELAAWMIPALPR